MLREYLIQFVTYTTLRHNNVNLLFTDAYYFVVTSLITYNNRQNKVHG